MTQSMTYMNELIINLVAELGSDQVESELASTSKGA